MKSFEQKWIEVQSELNSLKKENDRLRQVILDHADMLADEFPGTAQILREKVERKQ